MNVSDRDEVKRGGTRMLPGFMSSRMKMVSKNSPPSKIKVSNGTVKEIKVRRKKDEEIDFNLK